MKKTSVHSLFHSLLIVLALLFAGSAFAKLPAPSDEAKLKALETKQKGAHGDKVAAYQLCKSQDKTAERYRKGNKDAGPAFSAPKCEDPGPFVFVPPEAASAAPAAATPPASPAATAPSAAPAAPMATATPPAAPASAKK